MESPFISKISKEIDLPTTPDLFLGFIGELILASGDFTLEKRGFVFRIIEACFFLFELWL